RISLGALLPHTETRDKMFRPLRPAVRLRGKTMSLIAGLLFTIMLVGCQNPASQEKTELRSTAQVPSSLQVSGLHNVYRITDNLVSGSSPEGEEGFRSLKELGI